MSSLYVFLYLFIIHPRWIFLGFFFGTPFLHTQGKGPWTNNKKT